MQRDNLQQVSVLQDACARLHEQARDAAYALSLSHRYECLPGCLERPGKVIGTGFYDMVNNRVVVTSNTYYDNCLTDSHMSHDFLGRGNRYEVSVHIVIIRKQ